MTEKQQEGSQSSPKKVTKNQQQILNLIAELTEAVKKNDIVSVTSIVVLKSTGARIRYAGNVRPGDIALPLLVMTKDATDTAIENSRRAQIVAEATAAQPSE